MRHIGSLHPTEGAALPPDTVGAAVLAAGTASTFDIPTGAGLMRLAGATTAGAAFAFALNYGTTGAQWPAASYQATTATSQLNQMVPAGGALMVQISTGSTAFSLISGSSGIVTIEFWKK